MGSIKKRMKINMIKINGSFIDEFELGLHPNWQKRFFHILVKFQNLK